MFLAFKRSGYVELLVNALVWKLVELSLVGLHLHDEVDEVLWLLKTLQVFRLNHVSEVVFDLHDEFDQVQRVQSVLGLQVAL